MAKDEGLVRGIGLPGAISLNMINMIGVGPFVTLPLIVLAMHGPQAILGWVLGAVLARLRRTRVGRAGRGYAPRRRLL